MEQVENFEENYDYDNQSVSEKTTNYLDEIENAKEELLVAEDGNYKVEQNK